MKARIQFGPVVCLLAVLFTACSREPKNDNKVAARFYAVEAEPNHTADLSKRKVFPFSIVPGGTMDREEVKAKVEIDPVVREHYKGIDLDKLKPFRLTRPASGYVSYRIGNRIFWTAKRLYLKPGEILLSDGVNVLRGRCGNRVSLQAMGPVQRVAEPSEATLDAPSWDGPVFQAMVREASGHDSGLPFDLPGNLPQMIATLQRDLPDAYFPVAPAPGGLSAIGGSLPGGLSTAGGSEPFLPTYQTPIVYVTTPVQYGGVPGFVITPMTPADVPFQVVSTFFTPAVPIGTTVSITDVPTTPREYPPAFSVPATPIYPTGGDPIVTLLTPPGDQPPVITDRPVVTPPGTTPPPPDFTPPDAQPPPLEPVPEPSTLLLMPAAAALFYYLRRAATAKAGS